MAGTLGGVMAGGSGENVFPKKSRNPYFLVGLKSFSAELISRLPVPLPLSTLTVSGEGMVEVKKGMSPSAQWKAINILFGLEAREAESEKLTSILREQCKCLGSLP